MGFRSLATFSLLAVAYALAFAMPALAQPADELPAGPAPAHLSYIDGDVVLEREERAEPGVTGVPLIGGDRLRTARGRAEVIFGDGSVLDVDDFTTVDFLSDELIRLLDGRLRLEVGGRDPVSYRIDTPSGAVRIETPGEYRVSLIGSSGAADVELVALRGEAVLANEFGETSVRAGERAVAAAALAPSYAEAYNSARWDAFDVWVEDRRSERTGTTSARYLPDEIHGYGGDFDRYGDWRHDHEYGYVWYPRVHVAWRPYYYGHWRWYGPWGWTWISYDRWGWVTHHYGRWGFRAGVWFWIPKRRWAPAWVHWASAPGYIGWCPLGWNNRPVFSIINVNVINLGRGYDPYYGWTVIPRRSFGLRTAVARHAVPRDALRRAVPRWTVQSASAPVRPAVASPAAAPIYSAGRRVARPRPADVTPGAAAPAPSRRAVARDRAAAPASGAARIVKQRTPRTDDAPPAAALPASPRAIERGAARPRTARPRYRDLGPGGLSAPPAAADAPRAGARSRRAVPSRVRPEPDDSPDAGVRRDFPGAPPRAVPRGTPPPRQYSTPEPRREGPGGFDRPGDGNRNARPRAVPRSGPPAAVPRAPDRPAGGAISPAPRGSRAPVMRGGSESRGQGDRASSRGRAAPSGPSNSTGGESRRARPRPRPQ